MEKISYSKLQVAKGHLEVSIESFFNEQPAPSVHLLSSAANAIFRDLPGCKENKFLKSMEEMIKPGYQKEFYTQMNRHYNFFKHAKDDCEEVIEFDERASDFTILQGCIYLSLIDKNVSYHVQAFQAWFYLFHPNLFNFPEPMHRQIIQQMKEFAVETLSRNEAKKLGRNFLNAFKVKSLKS